MRHNIEISAAVPYPIQRDNPIQKSLDQLGPYLSQLQVMRQDLGARMGRAGGTMTPKSTPAKPERTA